MTVEPGKMLSHYRIGEKIGEGGMGVVYRAEDTKLRRQLAIKVLPPELVADEERRLRFLREARTAAAVNHPNIATIYEIDEVDGILFIAMELIEGQSLRVHMSGQPMTLGPMLRLATEIAEGLSRAHQSKVIHRDLKPDNVVVTTDGHAKILDFGLAKLLEVPSGSEDPEGSELATMSGEMTREGKILGTAAYMSPEQARGQAVDARSDLFSFGSMLYQMATGKQPFSGGTTTDLLSAILRDQPQPASQITGAPSELDRIITQCLEKDPRDRYQHAAQLAVDLRKLRRTVDSGVHSAADSSGPLTAAPSTGQVVLAGGGPRRLALVTLVVLLAVVGGWATWRALSPSPTETSTVASGRPAALAPEEETIQLAVLPFQNVRDDARIDYLGFALADAVISKLSYLRSVTVRPSSYIQKYRDQNPDPQQVGADLGIDHLLTGSLLAQGDDLRISVQLVDLTEGVVRWEDTVDARLDNLLEVQDQVVARIVSGMRIRLTEEEASQLQLDTPSNPEAFALYLRARALPETVEGNRTAIDLLERSIEQDETHAPAWVELSDRQRSVAMYTEGDRGLYEEAERSILRALEINPDSPEALWSHSTSLTEHGRHEEAYLLLRGWLKRDPYTAQPHFSLSYLLRYTGLLERGAEALEQAILLNPGNPGFRSGGHIYLYQGDFSRAEPVFALDRGSGWSLTHIATLAYLRGDPARARVLMEQVVAMDPDAFQAQQARAWLLALDGDKAAAAAVLKQGLADLSPDPEGMFEYGADLAWVGDYESARDLFDRAVKGGFYCYPAFQNDPRLQVLFTRDEFKPILESARRRHEEFKAFVAANP